MEFYGLGGLVTTPLLFGYMVGNLGVSPSTGETVSKSNYFNESDNFFNSLIASPSSSGS